MVSSDPIDFADLNEALLDRAHILVPQWLPGGREVNGEWVCADLNGGEGRSCSVNLKNGRWADFSGDDDKGGDLVSLYAAIHNLSQIQAARQLIDDLGWRRGPVQAPAQRSHRGEAAPRDSPAGDGRPEPPPTDDAAPAQGKRKSMWRAIVPVPRDTPAPTFKHFERGLPERSWAYEFEGQLYGHVCRFRTSDGGKEILPYTWCVDESDGRGTCKWTWKQWEEPRPLFIPAALLSGDPANVPVVLVEGEKCAQAGHELLGHEFDFVSWPGGGKAWSKARWGWLMGRTVYLWPDCDAKRQRLNAAERAANVDPATKALLPEAKQPGMQAMVGIGQVLMAEHGCTVFMCPVPAPGAVADGWDIADAIEQGWNAEDVRAFVRGARPFVPPDDAVRAAAGASGAGKPPRSTAPAEEGGGGDDAHGDDPSIAWRSYLMTSAKGATLAVRENVVLALDGWPERGVSGVPEAAGLIVFNEFTNNVEKTRQTPWGSPAGVWDEHDELQMGEWLAREHWLPSMSRNTLEEAVLMVSRRHSYHPVREHVEARRGAWDGEPRLHMWLRRCCLEEDEWDESDPLQRYLSLVGKWFVMGLCVRVLPAVKDGTRIVRGPGTKFDAMLVFEGPQGAGKSTMAAVLGLGYHADTGLDLSNKDSLQNIQGVLIYEWAELDGMPKADVRKVKSFISSAKDRFRASFDRRPKDYPRQVLFVGTTNERHYLIDTTGNRRFWPVTCTREPDVQWLRDNLDQLIAEALVCLDAGERFWPTKEEQRELFAPQQQARQLQSSLESAIRAYLYDEDQKVPHGGENGTLVSKIGLTQLLNRIGYTIDKQTDAIAKQAAAVMHALGWDLKRDSNGARPYHYHRPPKSTTQSRGPAAASTTAPTTQGDQRERAADDCPF